MRSPGRWSVVSEDLYGGPSLLAPVKPRHNDLLARVLIWPLLLILFATTIVFYILFSPLHVVGESMEPSLFDGDRVLRSKGYDEPRRGDVIIIDTMGEGDEDDIVKRVVGVAGDTVEIRDDIAIVNGSVESTAHILLMTGQGIYLEPTVVPPGHVFVLGDNRPISLDSRYIGPLPTSRVLGRAAFVFLPFEHFGALR